MLTRPSSAEIPDGPGVYLFRDEHGEVLYVGKAKSLRKRLANYFASDLSGKTAAMVGAAASVEWIVTASEVAALMAEYALVHEHLPRYNIRLKDDKSFPFLALTVNEEWPRAMVVRGRHRRGIRYFGPYVQAHAIRNTLDLMLRTFPIRTCTDAKFRRHATSGRPCLLFHIEKCAGPCVGEIAPDDYRDLVDGMASFFSGNSAAVTERLQSEMQDAAGALDYERAARIRDRLQSVERAMQRQELVTDRPEDFDVIAVSEDELEAALVVLNIRRGRITGRRTTIVDRVEEVGTAELIGILITELYGSERPPREVLVQELPVDAAVMGAWLAERRGSGVSLRVPKRGAKRRVLETAIDNAVDGFKRHRLRRHSDHNARARALNDLQEALGLPQPPLRIECYDISTIQGTNTVASMVVFEDGMPKKSDYRRFKIRTVDGQDDFASMEEVIRRRLAAYLAERELPVEERGRFAYPPSLIVIDGGPGQLGRAVRVIEHFGLDIPAVGLAKRLEEVYLPGRPDPVVIARGHESLYLLQRIRDEAHRFAITYHRTLRGKSMVDSILDDVDGIGPARKKALIRRFGSLKRIRAASKEDLADVLPDRVVTTLWETLHG